MSVEVQYLGRLGNQLFQYAFGRIVAEALGYELSCVPHGVARRSFFNQPLDCGADATLPSLTAYFKNAPQLLPGKHVVAPEERYIFGNPGPDGVKWDGHHIDLPALVADRRDRRLILRGFFQRFELYRAHRAQLREWFALEPLDEPYGITKRDIVVNIRRGWDYALNGWALSLSAYAKLLATVPHDRVFVCGVGIDDDVRASLARFSPIQYSSTPIDELRFIGKFDKIVQSNSTFCWWAAFLSEATALYTPRPDRGFLAKDSLGDALDTGEERYRLFDARVAEFIPFQRNREATLRLDQDAAGATSLIIESAVAMAKVACAPALLPFYRWLVDTREPFGMARLLGFMAKEEVEPVIAPLVENGALRLEPSFVDND